MFSLSVKNFVVLIKLHVPVGCFFLYVKCTVRSPQMFSMDIMEQYLLMGRHQVGKPTQWR